jgi:hypothetical protein
MFHMKPMGYSEFKVGDKEIVGNTPEEQLENYKKASYQAFVDYFKVFNPDFIFFMRDLGKEINLNL